MTSLGDVGAGVGSTRIWYEDEPTKIWSLVAALIGDGLPNPLRGSSTLSVLSRSVQVAPPSMERRTPTPVLPELPSPVAAKMIDWVGSLFRPKTAMLLMRIS